MARSRSQILGASRLRKKLLRLPEAITDQVREAVRRGGDELLFEMQRRAPVSDEAVPLSYKGTPRQHLQTELESRISKNGLTARVGLLGKKKAEIFFFWKYLEFGTKKMEKRPFAFPAWKAVRDKIRRDIRNSAIRGMRVVVRSNPSDR